MKLELITNEFKNMLVKAAKGAGNDKLAPLTTYLGIGVRDNTLYVRSTDGANFLVMCKNNVVCEDFDVVVECNTFVNLVKKTTSEHIILDIQDNVINVKGNGYYHVACVVDEHGQSFAFPKAEKNFILGVPTLTIKSKVMQVVNDVNTASVAKVYDNPVLTGFYFGDSVMTTDGMKMCVFAVNVFKTPVLLSLDFVRLSAMFVEEDIEVFILENDIVFRTNSMMLFGSQLTDIDSYPVDSLQNLMDVDFESVCTIKKALLSSVLDRMSIFVNEYDKHAVRIIFKKDGILFKTKKAEEKIPYDTSENFRDFNCLIELPKLKEQVNTLQEDIVEFVYGNPDFLRFNENKITHILSVMEEDI